jgi:hypothetical protein
MQSLPLVETAARHRARAGCRDPCHFSVDEPLTWFAMDGNKIVSNWDPGAGRPGTRCNPFGAHQIAITASPVGFGQHRSFRISVTAPA